MRYHTIINGCSDSCIREMEEVRGFIKSFAAAMEQGRSYIFCREDADLKQLAIKAPTADILFIKVAYYDPEIILEILAPHINPADTYLLPGNYAGTELAVRLGSRSRGSSVTGILKLQLKAGHPVVSKMVYANHMEGTFEIAAMPCFLSIAKGRWQDTEKNEAYQAEQETGLSYFGQQQGRQRSVIANEVRFGLQDTRFLVAVGRGAGNQAATAQLKEYAEALQADFGVSRPAAMNAWAAMESLVGVSGQMVKPEICIAAGVSGAAAFYAGIEKSKFIVAINTDPDAPIMKRADLAIVADCQETLAALAAYIKGEAV